jgi:hypothetical protein
LDAARTFLPHNAEETAMRRLSDALILSLGFLMLAISAGLAAQL